MDVPVINACFLQIFPDMFDDFANLRSLKGAAEILAQYAGWGALYDEEQLAKNEVKVTAASCVSSFHFPCFEPCKVYYFILTMVRCV